MTAALLDAACLLAFAGQGEQTAAIMLVIVLLANGLEAAEEGERAPPGEPSPAGSF